MNYLNLRWKIRHLVAGAPSMDKIIGQDEKYIGRQSPGRTYRTNDH